VSAGNLPVTGAANPDLEPFDRLMTSFLEQNEVPGAALAVTHASKLVYARGFGCADVEKNEPVQPGALFRIASVSKPITAVAVMQLVERQKLKLDDKVVDLMKLAPFVAPGANVDARWKQITVRHCLQHTGGWDRAKSFDPIGRPWQIAKALDIRPPITPAHIVRYMMGQPLDFDPGERYAYSNLGYLVLGRIIEATTGENYEAYVKREVLGPLGVTTARLGRALFENRVEGEVRYYDAKKRTGPALYPPRLGQKVPLQYGAENFEAFEAHGGWIASALELVRFAAAFDDPRTCRILGAQVIEDMWARPEGAAGREPDGKLKPTFYGCGWSVRPIGTTGKCNTWHTGFIAGTESLLVRRWDGLNWAVLFNTHHNPDGKSLAGLIDGRLHEAADTVKAWPDTDQFGSFLKRRASGARNAR
jgi:N-acyl-D-amino-acid deacylase